ncbi:MAG: amino acid racemase [Candidatus Cloacimonetes bacterium]|nr:amino acid racemase [Candidatus Cloacimonadota bacterium]
MKSIGIIGGLGPESTLYYYKNIISTFNKNKTNLVYPEIIIISVNTRIFIELLEKKKWDTIKVLILDKLNALSCAGADFAIISSNSFHSIFDELQSKSPIPLLSIVEETGKYAEQLNLKTLGLLGTMFTMESDFYQKSFKSKGMRIVLPDKEEQLYIHEKLFSEIEFGIIKQETKNSLLTIVNKMITRHSIDALILGCTELPLILTQDGYDIPFLNTTAIHVDSIIKYCMTE